MPISALLLDIDGTLVDSNDFHVSAWDEVFREAGYSFGRGAIHQQVGKGGDNFVPAFLPDLPQERQEALAHRHGEIYKGRYMEQVRPFPGARDLLVRAKEDGLALALATSASAAELEHYRGLLDAADLIDFTTSKDDVETSKPAPDIFQAALAKTGVAASQALVIGDTPYDVIAASGCGVRTLALLSGGFALVELQEAGALAVYPGVAALLADYESSPIKNLS